MYHGLFQTALFLKNLFSSYQLYDKALVCCCYPSVIYQVRIRYSIQLCRVNGIEEYTNEADWFLFHLFLVFFFSIILVGCLLIYQIKCTLIPPSICLFCPFSSKHFLMTFYYAFKVTSEATFLGVWLYHIISLDTQDRSENHYCTSLVERQLQLQCNWRKGTSWDW